MLSRWRWLMVPALAVGVWAGEEPWKDKDSAQWSEDEAKQVITDSPWAKTVLPEVAGAANSSRRGGGGGGRGGGIGIGGIGIGLPGMGRRGSGYPGGGGNPQSGGRPADDAAAPTLTVRWESALPVREAELKAHSTGNPEVDEGHYGIAVYGLPGRMTNGDSKTMADALKREASIKREGKKDLKPSSVEVIRGEDGPVILYLFPRSVEIVKSDRRMEFDAQIDKLKFEQAFYLEDMVYRGKLEL